MSDVIVYRIPKKEGEEIRFTIREFKGKKYLDMRVFYKSQQGDVWIPTRKGISPIVTLASEFQKGLAEAVKSLTLSTV